MSSWRKNGQDLAQTSRKWRKKISNGESDGERKIYPSANPVNVLKVENSRLQWVCSITGISERAKTTGMDILNLNGLLVIRQIDSISPAGLGSITLKSLLSQGNRIGKRSRP